MSAVTASKGKSVLEALFERESADWRAVNARLQDGLGFDSVLELQRWLEVPIKELAEIVGIPERTLLLRKRQRRLTVDESHRLYRVVRIVFLTLKLFEGDAHVMRRWLKEPCLAFWNRIPVKLLNSEVGARAVENVIGRLEYGVYT